MEIVSYNQIAIMITDPEESSRRFFDREDKEKKFLLEEIGKCKNPTEVYDNFISAIAQVNRNQYNHFKNSGMFIVERKENAQEETLERLAKHFGLK